MFILEQVTNHDYSFFDDAFQNHGHCAKKIDYNGEWYSVVIKEYIPDYSIVIGNPAVVVSNRTKLKNFDSRPDIGLF